MKTKLNLLLFSLLTLCGTLYSETILNKRSIQMRPQGYYAIVDSLSGKVIKALKYDEVKSFKEGLAVVKLDDKWGVIDSDGIEIVAPKYSSINLFMEGRAVVVMNNKFGIIDKKGIELVTCTYDIIENYVDGLALVYNSGKQGYVNLQGIPICPIKYDDVDVVIKNKGNKLLRVKLSDKYGYIDKSGKELIAPQYDYAENGYKFSGGIGIVMKDSIWGAINESGTIVIPLKYKFLGHLSDGLILFKEKEKYGYINLKEERIIQPIYQYASEFTKGLAIVSNNNKYGVINKVGKFIIPAEYEEFQLKIEINKNSPYIIGHKEVDFFNTGMPSDIAFCFDKTGKSLLPYTSSINNIWLNDDYIKTAQFSDYSYGNYGMYNYSGDLLIPNEYKEIKEVINSVYLTINRNNKFSVYNNKGKQIIGEHDFIFLQDSLFYVNNGGSVENNTIQGGKNGIFDLSGNKISELKYDYIGSHKDNFAMVVLNNKFGFINKVGIEVVPPTYDYIIEGQFFDDVATVNIGGRYDAQGQFSGGKWGFIDSRGIVIAPIEYEAAFIFNEGVVSVKKDGLVGAIDKTNKVVIPFQFQDLGVFREGVAYFVKDNLFGFIDKTGKIILNNTFQYAGDFNDGMAMVAKDNKVGYINRTGNIVIPIQYDNGDIFIDGYAIVVKNGQNHLINKNGEVIK